MPILGPPGALSPQQWGAQRDYDTWRDFYTPDDGVALHHGGGSDYRAGRQPFSQTEEIRQLRAWEDYHIKPDPSRNKAAWRGLAYGWAVGQTGTIYRARGWASYGAHTGDVDGDGIANNSEIIPIIFLGSGNHHVLSAAAQEAIARLRRFLEDQAPAATYLYGHQEISPATGTTCPGPNLMTYVKANRLLEDDMPLSDDDIRRIWAFPTLTGGVNAQLALTRTERGVNALLLRESGAISEADLDDLAQSLVDALDDDLAVAVADVLAARLVS